MRGTSPTRALCALLAAGAAAKTLTVEVGKGGLTFSPESIKADVGDVVEFHFSGNQHSVVLGDPKKACSPVSSNGFYSGTLPAGDKSVFSVTVMTTSPLVYYCSVDSHCQNGMAGIINEGAVTLAAYRSMAVKAGENVSPPAPFGGIVGSGSGSGGGGGGEGGMASSASSGAQATSQPASVKPAPGGGGPPTSHAGRLHGSVAGASGLALGVAALAVL